MRGAWGRCDVYPRPTDVIGWAQRARLRTRGVPVVFVHGFGTEGAVNWYAQVEEFSRGFDVVAADRAGWGRSERLSGTNCIALHVRCLRILPGDLGIARASLVGQSMGGWVRLAFAPAHPGRVKRLIVLDAAGLRFEPDMALERALLPATLDDVCMLVRTNFQRPVHLPTFLLRDLLPLARCEARPREELLRRLVSADEHVEERLAAIARRVGCGRSPDPVGA